MKIQNINSWYNETLKNHSAIIEKEDSNISQYISEIVEDFSVMNPVDYCKNSVVNLVTHRYYEICKKIKLILQ